MNDTSAAQTAIATALANAGMTAPEYVEHSNKVFEGQQKQDAFEAETAAIPTEVGDTTNSITLVIHKDDKGNVTRENTDEVLNALNKEFVEQLPKLVNETFRMLWTDMFRIASLTTLDYGVPPGFHEAGRALQACYNPEAFAFDKDTVNPNDARDTDGIVQPMTPAMIREKQAQGLRPMSNTQWLFYLETTVRVLDRIAMMHGFKAIGYYSDLKREDVWQTAVENEKTRQKSFAERRELESMKREKAATEALAKVTATGGVLDF